MYIYLISGFCDEGCGLPREARKACLGSKHGRVDETVEHHPWMVGVNTIDNEERTKRTIICSASLLSNRAVITAAHCFDHYIDDLESAKDLFLYHASCFKKHNYLTIKYYGNINQKFFLFQNYISLLCYTNIYAYHPLKR